MYVLIRRSPWRLAGKRNQTMRNMHATLSLALLTLANVDTGVLVLIFQSKNIADSTDENTVRVGGSKSRPD